MSIGTLEFLFTYVFLKLIMNEKEELGTNFMMPLVFPENKLVSYCDNTAYLLARPFLVLT